jgi:hypothetical protein
MQSVQHDKKLDILGRTFFLRSMLWNMGDAVGPTPNKRINTGRSPTAFERVGDCHVVGGGYVSTLRGILAA